MKKILILSLVLMAGCSLAKDRYDSRGGWTLIVPPVEWGYSQEYDCRGKEKLVASRLASTLYFGDAKYDVYRNGVDIYLKGRHTKNPVPYRCKIHVNFVGGKLVFVGREQKNFSKTDFMSYTGKMFAHLTK